MCPGSIPAQWLWGLRWQLAVALLWVIFSAYSGFSPSTKTNITKFRAVPPGERTYMKTSEGWCGFLSKYCHLFYIYLFARGKSRKFVFFAPCLTLWRWVEHALLIELRFSVERSITYTLKCPKLISMEIVMLWYEAAYCVKRSPTAKLIVNVVVVVDTSTLLQSIHPLNDQERNKVQYL